VVVVVVQVVKAETVVQQQIQEMLQQYKVLRVKEILEDLATTTAVALVAVAE
jgi:hypothetical protein